MRRGAVRAAILFSTLVGACNALSGVGDLGVCPGDGNCAAIAEEAGTSFEAAAPEGSPGIDGASVDAGGFDAAPFFGTGRSGPLMLSAGELLVVNLQAALTGAAKAGDAVLFVSDVTRFDVGDLVLVWQTGGLASVVSGDQAPVVLAPSSVGHFEMARVASKTTTQVFLTAPLAFSYPVAASQVVRLPEYTDVTIPTGAKMVGLSWDGARGGIVAFLATGTVTVVGEIDADGLGFRGGVGYQGKGGGGCMLFDGVPEVGYAAKGEGIALDGYTTANDGGGIGGRGNLANGAGGGVCHNGGGAGGGHGGHGGIGGLGQNGLGGLAGVALQYPPLHALLMGGGGSAGDDNNGLPLPGGGAGGGVIFIHAHSIQGGGTITARGAAGLVAPGNDGSGGGGAGGGIVIVAETALQAIMLRAEGGPGGSATGAGGGGGGGGVVDVSTSSFQSSAVVTGGDGGGAAGSFQAGSGAMGRIDVGDGG